MAVALTVAELAEALRVGDSPEETAHMTRLLAFATEAVSKHLGNSYNTAPVAVVNEAAIRLAAYLYDKPHVAGASAANHLLNSGAGAILLPYRRHRAGSTGTVVAPPGTTSTPGAGIDTAAVQALIDAHAANPSAHHVKTPEAGEQEGEDAALMAHAADPDAHHTPTTPYVLPAAAPATRGGVQAITNAIIDTGTSTGIFGWAISHVRRAVNAIVPTWAQIGNTDLVPDAKLRAASVTQRGIIQIAATTVLDLPESSAGVGVAVDPAGMWRLMRSSGALAGAALTDLGSYSFIDITGTNIQTFRDTGLNIPSGATWLYLAAGAITAVHPTIGSFVFGPSSWHRVLVADIPTVTVGSGLFTDVGAGANRVRTLHGVHVEGLARAGDEDIRIGRNGDDLLLNIIGSASQTYTGSVRVRRN